MVAEALTRGLTRKKLEHLAGAEAEGWPERRLARLAKAMRLGLSRRQLELLEHVHSFGLSTPPLLGRAFLPGKRPVAVRSFVRRLVTRKLLESAPLYPPRAVCYFLTERGHAFFEEKKRRPLSRNGLQLAIRLGVVSFAVDGLDRRRHLSAAEFQREFPDLAAFGGDLRRFYVEAARDAQPWRLGYVQIDCDGDVTHHLSHLSRNIVGPRLENDEWRTHILNSKPSRFALGFVSSSLRKVEALEARVREQWPAFAFHGCVVPELAMIRKRRPGK